MHDGKPNILLMSYAFPPNADIGAKRFANLSRILHDNYFNLHILTVTENCFTQTDYSINYSGNIHRITAMPRYPIKKLKKSFLDILMGYVWENYLSIIDPFIGWVLPGFIAGLKIIKKYNIRLIIVTGPPFSPLISACLLSRVTGAKLILDYRDPWNSEFKTYPKIFGKKINILLERFVVKRASDVVVVTAQMKEDFLRKFPYHENTCHVITNGFYPAADVLPLPLETDKKVILYAGSFYGQRSISPLIEALQQLIENKEIDINDFKIHLFGHLNSNNRDCIRSSRLIDAVIEHPFKEHKTVLRYLKGADVLFLVSGYDQLGSVVAKLYDYLSVQRPILALAPEHSAMEHIMSEIDCGEFAIITDIESVTNKLRSLLAKEKQYTFAGSEKYTLYSTAKQYAMIIRDVLKS